MKAFSASPTEGMPPSFCNPELVIQLLDHPYMRVGSVDEYAHITVFRSRWTPPICSSCNQRVLAHPHGSKNARRAGLHDILRAAPGQVAFTNPLEQLNKEVKRRAVVVGIFPNEDSIVRLVGAVFLERNDLSPPRC